MYVEEVVGLTIAVEFVPKPLDQRYVPPDCDGVAVRVEDPPEQIVVEFTLTVGAGLIVTVIVVVKAQVGAAEDVGVNV